MSAEEILNAFFPSVDRDPDDPVVVPIEDSLDLHTFRPAEVKDLLSDYLEAAWEKGFREVRVIHGKGSGTLRKTVHAILSRHARVASFRDAEPGSGGWGATRIVLTPSGESR